MTKIQKMNDVSDFYICYSCDWKQRFLQKNWKQASITNKNYKESEPNLKTCKDGKLRINHYITPDLIQLNYRWNIIHIELTLAHISQ